MPEKLSSLLLSGHTAWGFPWHVFDAGEFLSDRHLDLTRLSRRGKIDGFLKRALKLKSHSTEKQKLNVNKICFNLLHWNSILDL